VFFAVLLCAAIFTAWIAYSVFAPEVATMPDIEPGFSDQPHLSNETDVDTILNEADRAALPANVPLPPQGAHVQGTMTLKQFGQRVKAKYPVYNDLDDESLARSVLAKYPQYRDVIKEAGRTAATSSGKPTTEWDANGNPIHTNHGPWAVVAVDGKPVKGLPPGAIVTPITPDLTSFQPVVKLVKMPDGSTSRFASTVSDDVIKKQWSHAKRIQTWKAIGWAGLFTVAIALFVNYLLQGSYRTLLYVIFGTTERAATTMVNTVKDALEYNKGALAAVWSQLSGATLPSSPRNDLVRAYVSIAIKHHEGIYTLVNQNVMASAFALLRSQIETSYRGLWVNLIATDQQVNAIRDRDETPFPRFRQMATDLDVAYRAGGWLQGFADRWAALNGYTHSGLLQLGRQFRHDGTIAPNYSDEMVTELLVVSGTASIGCIVPIFRGMHIDDKAVALEQWFAEHPFYRKRETPT
jgi:hypothetical protein